MGGISIKTIMELRSRPSAILTTEINWHIVFAINVPSFEYFKWIINRQERFNIGSFRKNMWIFNFSRLYLLKGVPPLTWNPGSAPASKPPLVIVHYYNLSFPFSNRNVRGTHRLFPRVNRNKLTHRLCY
jgi:hypothetical protein